MARNWIQADQFGRKMKSKLATKHWQAEKWLEFNKAFNQNPLCKTCFI